MSQVAKAWTRIDWYRNHKGEVDVPGDGFDRAASFLSKDEVKTDWAMPLFMAWKSWCSRTVEVEGDSTEQAKSRYAALQDFMTTASEYPRPPPPLTRMLAPILSSVLVLPADARVVNGKIERNAGLVVQEEPAVDTDTPTESTHSEPDYTLTMPERRHPLGVKMGEISIQPNPDFALSSPK